MSLIIQIVGGYYNGLYIQEFHPDTDPLGLGEVITTPHADMAKQFADFESAIEFWKQQSKRMPLRPDGKPNRPLTAFSITFEHTDENSDQRGD
jgi:hypothetical protein